MPSPNFNIVRVAGRYPVGGIVCDECYRRFSNSSNCYYEVVRDGYRVNQYPFHSVCCAENWIIRYTQFTGIHPIIHICSDEQYDTQEETTED